jgi:hypothetical protein
MSLKSSPIVQAPYLYPAGNTPAVCLSQSLPPEQDGTLLLLGCGDVRNILFTIYSGAGNSKYCPIAAFHFSPHALMERQAAESLTLHAATSRQ